MKRIIKTGSIAFVALSLSGCGNTGAPDCTDDDVKESVINIVTKEVRDSISAFAFMPFSLAMRTDPSLQQKFVNVDTSNVDMNSSYAVFNAYKSKDKGIEVVIDSIDNAVSDIKMDVTGIRINSVDDKIKKSECVGNVTTSIGTIENVKYLAQYTEDNQLYVQIASAIKKAVFDIILNVKVKRYQASQETPISQENTTPAPAETALQPESTTSAVMSPPPEKIEATATSNEQAELSRYKAKDAFNEADKQLNVIWKKLSKSTRQELLPSQRQWLKKRDSDCNLKAASQESNNTILQDVIRFDCMAEMTNERTYEIGKNEIGVLPGD